MNEFGYAQASNTADAARHFAAGTHAKYLGGGTNLIDLMRETIEQPDMLVDVTALSQTIEARDDGSLIIGAAAKNTAVASHAAVRTRFPMLARAILSGASGQIRNMATTGGNLLQRTRCHYFYDHASRCNKRDPGAGCDAIEGFNRMHAILGTSPSCVATHPSDMAVALVALDTILHVAGKTGERELKLTDLHRLPGGRPDRETTLAADELITAIEIPPLPCAANSTYRKVRDRASYAFALVSVAAAIDVGADGRIGDVRVALGGVAPKPWRAWKAEAVLKDADASAANFRRAAEAELDDAAALRDNGFKIELAARVITATAERAEPGEPLMNVVRDAMQAIGLAPREAPDRLIGADRVIGKPVSRIDGPLKVTGRARFAAEVPYDDVAYASLVNSTIARGRIQSIDTAAASAAPGVLLVMTHENAPRLPAPKLMMNDPNGAAGSDLPVMQDASIHWNGEPVALVVANTQEQADHAASLVNVTYHADRADIAFDALKSRAHQPQSVLGELPRVTVGDAEAALAGAPFRVDRVYRTPRHNHCAIEPHAVTIAWEAGGMVVHDASQLINLTRSTMAALFGLADDKVRVLSPFVGGAFGSKGVWSHHVLAACAAKLAKRPVRLSLKREDVFRMTGGRTLTEQRVALGTKADGTLAALIHTGIAGMTAHNNCPEQFTFPARHLYAADTILLEQNIIELDMVSNTFMRAPGESVGTFALESAIDELANTMRLDPIELRRRWEPEKDPTSGLEFSSRHLLEAYRRGAELFGWSRRNPVPGSQRDGDWLIGQGVATATYPYFRMPGGVARITLTSAGRAIVSMASHEMGMGTATVQAQAAAERLGLRLEDVEFVYGDSDLPRGTLAGGSSQTASIIAAVAAAAELLVRDVLKLAGNDSPLAGLKPDAVEARDGGLCERDNPARCETYVSILARARRDDISVQADAPPPAEMRANSMHSYGAQFCEIRVNAITGEARVSRFVGSFDTGRILNPKTAASQFRGGIIMGLGLALTEATLFDERTGRIMNPSLAEYHVPVHMDVPPIEVIWNDIADPHSPLGVHGIGEIGITGVGAAVANAVFNATGKRIYELPITLDKLM